MAMFGRSSLKNAALVSLVAAACAAPGTVPADQEIIYECVDPDTGEISLRHLCRPGMASKEWAKLYKPGVENLSAEEVSELHPIELFTAQQCDSCELVRGYLERNDIPFQEKDVTAKNPQEVSKQTLDAILALQAELQERSGALSVPTVFIGGGKIDPVIGYNLQKLSDALKGVGYPLADE